MNKFKYLLYAVSSYAFVFGFCEYFHGYDALGNQSILNIFLFAGAFFLIEKGFQAGKKSLKTAGSVFSMLLSVALVVGKALYTENSIQGLLTPQGFVKAMITLVGYSVFLAAICNLLLDRFDKSGESNQCKRWKIFRYPLLLAGIIFLAWIPCYLAYYPGIMSYDIIIQTRQAMGIEEVTRFHPPLHTFLWKLCLELEEGIGWNGLVVYSLVQMMLMAGAFAYVLRFLEKKGCSNGMLLGTLLYSALNPVVAIFSFVPTKDATLTIALTLFIVELCDYVTSDNKTRKNIGQIVRLIVFGVLSCLLRNNVIYAMIFAGLLAIVVYRKIWKQIMIGCAGIVLGFLLINGPIYTLLGVGEGSSGEMLSVPLQQLASVVYYHGGELSGEDVSALAEFLPVEELAERFNFRLADPVKETFHSEEFDNHPLKFVKLWWEFFVRYPGEYVDAFLNLNLPYWYPDANSVDMYAKRNYIETFLANLQGFEYLQVRESKIPKLLEMYEKVASYDAFKTKPVLANIFSISTPIWLLVAGICILCRKRKKELIVPFLPMIGLWLTYMLGPTSNFRYMFPIIAIYPLFIALAMQVKKEE